MDHHHDELLEKIRRNDPSVTRLSIGYGMGECTRYGDALQGNTVVNDLSIALRQTDDGDSIDSLLNWIQTSPSLRKIRVGYGSRRIISRFLLAIANNAGIQHVELRPVMAMLFLMPTHLRPSYALRDQNSSWNFTRLWIQSCC